MKLGPGDGVAGGLEDGGGGGAQADALQRGPDRGRGQPRRGFLNGLGPQGGRQQQGGYHDLAPLEKRPQLFDRALQSLLRGIFANPQGNTRLPKAFVFKVAKQNRRALPLTQVRHGLIQLRGNVRPGSFRFRLVNGHAHGGSFLFPSLPPAFTAQRVQGGQARRPIEPGREDNVVRQAAGLPGEGQKDHLRNVAGQFRVAHLSENCRISQVEVALDK